MCCCRPRGTRFLTPCMAGRNWYAAQCTSGLARGKCTLPVAASFGITAWLLTTQWGPLSRTVYSSSHSNDVAFCALPTLLFSSAVLGTSDRPRERTNSGSRRDNEKKKSVLGLGVGNLFRFVPAAAKALGDGLRNIFWDAQRPRPTAAGGDDQRLYPGPPSRQAGTNRDGAAKEDERNSVDFPHLRKGGQRKVSSRDMPRGIAPEPPDSPRDSLTDTQNVSVIPLPSLESYPTTIVPQDPALPLGAVMPVPVPEAPSWLFLEGGRLRRVPYSARDANMLHQRAHYLAEEGVWTFSSPTPGEVTEANKETPSVQASPSKAGPWLSRPHSSSPINLEGVPESLKLLVVFPEEEVLFVDKQAARAIAKAASAVASSIVNYPSEKSRSLAKTFPADQRFYVIPRKGTTLFDQFGMVPGRFLGEGSFGVVFEGRSSAGVSFAVKVCVQTLWVPMTPAQEAKVLNECEASEIRIPELFPQTVDPPTLFYRYRMVVPLLTGHIAHLPPVFPLGKNMYGTQVCALYPSALCDVQQLSQSVSLPPAVQMELTRNMVTVVARLHLLGIVHLDIKLANFLIDQQGRVLLSDFGLAMKKQKFPVMISCRSGSPAFMSPEMIRCLAKNKNADGKIALSSKMDAFSLGVTLYMVWCGVLPFSAGVTGGTVNSLIDALDKVYKDGGHLTFQNCPAGEIQDSEIKAIITEFLRVEPEMRATPLDVVRASTIFLKRV